MGHYLFEAVDLVLGAVVVLLLEDEDEEDVEVGLDEVFLGGEGSDGLIEAH